MKRTMRNGREKNEVRVMEVRNKYTKEKSKEKEREVEKGIERESREREREKEKNIASR